MDWALPADVVREVLVRLPLRDRLTCQRVCKRWRDASLGPRVWYSAGVHTYQGLRQCVQRISDGGGDWLEFVLDGINVHAVITAQQLYRRRRKLLLDELFPGAPADDSLAWWKTNIDCRYGIMAAVLRLITRDALRFRYSRTVQAVFCSRAGFLCLYERLVTVDDLRALPTSLHVELVMRVVGYRMLRVGPFSARL